VVPRSARVCGNCLGVVLFGCLSVLFPAWVVRRLGFGRGGGLVEYVKCSLAYGLRSSGEGASISWCSAILRQKSAS
jgi:hypothetical protein